MTGGLVLTATACNAGPSAEPLPPQVAATPGGPVPGFDDPRRWAGRTVRVGAWGGEVQTALKEAVWGPFAAATGCTVQEVTTDYSRLAAAIANRASYADALLVDAIWAETALAEGQIQRLEPSTVDDQVISAFGGGEAAVPAFAYALVSAFRREGVGADGPPATWAEWWDATTYAGRRALARDPFGTFEFALMSDGVAPDQLYPLDGPRAIERLKAISGKIVDLWWDSGAQPVSWLGTERADLASAWHYRVFAGQQDGLAVDLVWNQGLLVADRWVVPVDAAEPAVANDLIRYAGTAEAQAALARRVPLGPVNAGAFDLLEPVVAATLPTAPANLPQLVRADAGWWSANRGEAVQQFNGWLLGKPGG